MNSSDDHDRVVPESLGKPAPQTTHPPPPLCSPARLGGLCIPRNALPCSRQSAKVTMRKTRQSSSLWIGRSSAQPAPRSAVSHAPDFLQKTSVLPYFIRSKLFFRICQSASPPTFAAMLGDQLCFVRVFGGPIHLVKDAEDAGAFGVRRACRRRIRPSRRVPRGSPGNCRLCADWRHRKRRDRIRCTRSGIR